MQICKESNITVSELIEVQCNVLFLLVFGVELAVKMREKESLECEGMHIGVLKPQKCPWPLCRPWTQAAIGLLCSCDSGLLHRQLLASEVGSPLTKFWIRIRIHIGISSLIDLLNYLRDLFSLSSQ